jgi:ketosteroid isomerase-like protein
MRSPETSNSESVDVELARESIDRLNYRFSTSFELGEASLTASVYAEDSVLFSPDSTMVHGLKAIERYWSKVMRSGVKKLWLTTLELIGAHEFIHENGSGVFLITRPGGVPTERKLKYVVVWKRTDAGWRHHWDIWNWCP